MGDQRVMVVGFAGLKGAGKDTAAAEVRRAAAELGWSTAHVAFADALREAAALMFGLSEEDMLDRDLKEMPLPGWDDLTPRRILQLLGTEVARSIHPDVWVRACRRRIDAVTSGPGPWLVTVTDVRFENEVEAIRAWGGQVVFVHRPCLGADVQHGSEAMAARWRMGPPLDVPVLHNEGSLGRFLARARDVTPDLLIPQEVA